MEKGTWRSEWLRQLVVALAYALIYIAVHPISDAHWQIRSGLRLACLLLVPYRYWAAMLAAEAIPNAQEVLSCLDQYGVGYASVRCIPPMLLAMPIVWWCRSRLALFPAPRLIDIKVLMMCVLAVTITWASYNYLSISFIHLPNFEAKPVMFVGYFIGNYIAILGIVPLALMARIDFRAGGLRAQLHHIIRSVLARDVMLFAVPFIAALSIVSLHGSEDMKQIARMSMFLPVAWLTLKYGWRAAVVGGALAVASTCLVTASKPDPQILEVQAFIALAITCLIATGARISTQLIQEDRVRRGEINVRRLARKNFQHNEQRRRQISSALEHIAGGLHVSNSQLIQQLRRVLPNVDSQGYVKQVQATQKQVYQLADSLHPLAWRERGLPAALKETIGLALGEAGIAYQCTISGRGFTRLAPSLLDAIYRSACEAVVLVSANLASTRADLTLRGGETNGKRWVVLRVEGTYSHDTVVNAALGMPERQRLAPKLGAIALDRDQLKDYARIFDGDLHTRSSVGCERITVLLQDALPDAEGNEFSSGPLRLVVG